MRLFQSGYFYPAYLPRFRQLSQKDSTFVAAIRTLLDDRTDAAHILLPVLAGDASAFYTASGDRYLQRMWAREQGMPRRSSDDDILLAQIEAHRTEVFYDMGPMLRGPGFLKRLPATVKRTIAWWAAPNASPSLAQYDLVVGNFAGLRKQHEKRGCRTAFLSPAYDPVMDAYAANEDRPVDVIFVGSYSQHHHRRNELLAGLAELAGQRNVAIHLHLSRRVRLAESLPGRLLPLAKERRPEALAKLARGPLFGRNFYAAMSRAKIAVNGAGEITGEERGNMRCFEAMGCGNLLLSDAGIYPPGMVPDESLVTYSSSADAIRRIEALLEDLPRLQRIAAAGHKAVSTEYSKARQWTQFQALAA
jgi:hypothetical protein